MWAAWGGDSTSSSALLQFGANPQASSFDGNSILIYGDSTECLRLLLSAGAEINHANHSLVTSTTSRHRIGKNLAIATIRFVRGALLIAN